MVSYKLYMIRHGVTQGNLEGKYIGSTDLPLCQSGRRALRKLRKEREYPTVQKVYTSPLQRCLDTAEILYPHALVQTVDSLREYDFGKFDGKAAAELAGDPDFQRWIDSGMTGSLPGAEDMQQFILRCEEGIDEVITDMMKNKVTEAALILHSGIMMNLLATHGYPKQEPLMWQAEPGEGFTAMITPQFWMMDRVFEVFDPIPYYLGSEDEPSEYGIYDIDEDTADGQE